ncbi:MULTISPECIES: DUF3284 domain-containing protein [Vagococcus]|uniref:PTS system, cellobiose-specific IIC component n=1 Tax=Vagococcus fluvialis bH819 TaxID=1255619 RepID=A0A1X6WLZ2_9ENTE|nr:MULTISPECIES: DUF3284 domain-containing protein [Vagococcus]SLM85268.1 PTS system, cellobiose-specific IIC component [Vagococcus fluvialis bH819]HCM89434.1 DUF3284 domain-containing protein [Vagococcus sp.]
MEIKKNLNVPATFFYKKITESILYDITQSTGNAIELKNAENYTYVKEFSKSSKAKITIQKLKENEEYQYRTTTSNNDFTVHYKIKKINDRECEITYKEEMVSHGALQKMNDMLFGIILGFFKKKRFIGMLNAIEKSYG